MLKHDVILTTYGTLAADFKRKQSIVYKIMWYRVILDEGDESEPLSSLDD